MISIDNIDPIKKFFSDKKTQDKIFNFLKRNNYRIIDNREYVDLTFDKSITNGKALPQVKNVGVLGKIDIKDIKSIQTKRKFKKLQKQINRILEKNYAPITIDSNGHIVNGHHRYDALRILKYKRVKVMMLNLNAKDIAKLNLGADELNELLKDHSFKNSKITSFIPIKITNSLLRKIS